MRFRQKLRAAVQRHEVELGRVSAIVVRTSGEIALERAERARIATVLGERMGRVERMPVVGTGGDVGAVVNDLRNRMPVGSAVSDIRHDRDHHDLTSQIGVMRALLGRLDRQVTRVRRGPWGIAARPPHRA